MRAIDAGYASEMFRSARDRCLAALDDALRTVSGVARASRPLPRAPGHAAVELSVSEKKLAGSLMRVTHVGEVCAQALYRAQALTARSGAGDDPHCAPLL